MAEAVRSGSFCSSVKEELMGNNRNIKSNDILVNITCTIVFVVFTFVYLYCYQADLLTAMQHVFSKGQTHYNHLIGASLITFILLLVQRGVSRLCQGVRVANSLTYLPSALLLTFLTSAHPDITYGGFSFGGWAIALPVLLVVFAGLVMFSFKSGLSEVLSDIIPTQYRRLWVNLAIMTAEMSFVGCLSYDDATFHNRINAEQCILDGDYDGALASVARNAEADENLTMLAAYALSKKGTMADELFEYKLKGKSASLVPNKTITSFVVYPDSVFYGKMGGWFRQPMSASRYFDYLRRHSRLRGASVDYYLCGMLMDCNLPGFAKQLPKYYTLNDSLPKHYKEALILYRHRYSNPAVVYDNAVTNADYQDFQKLSASLPDQKERKKQLADTYGNTYWYYYQYNAKRKR